MDQFDTDLIEYMLAWAPFGGPPPDDAFPRFGLTSDVLWLRFQEIIARAPTRFRQFSSEIKDLLDRAPATASPGPVSSQAPDSPEIPSKSPDILDATKGQWNLHNGVRVWTPHRPDPPRRRRRRSGEASSS